MAPDEAEDRGFLDGIGALADQPLHSAALPVSQTTSLTGTRCLEILGSQLASRHLDLAARVLRSEGKGFYTIGSAGHEANAFVAGVLRPTDPALLHYRSGAFFAERARQVPGQDPIRDTLLGVVAAADERGDGGWLARYAPPSSWAGGHVPLGSGRTYGDGGPDARHVRQRAAAEPARPAASPRPGSGRQADRPRWDSASMVTAASRTSAVTM